MPLRSALDGIYRDIRFAGRMLRKAPMFTAVAVVSLALGIGSNTAVFSIVSGVLKGLPFKDAERIVYISEVDRTKMPVNGAETVSEPDFLDIRQQSRSFVDLATFGTGTYNISDDTTAPERAIGSRVTTNLFSLVDQKPLIGRDFTSDDEQAGAPAVAIIGYAIWQTRYGGRPDILGKTLRVNGTPHTIIAVMPGGMRFPLLSDIWLLRLPPTQRSLDRSARDLDVFGLLRDGISVKNAESELNGIAKRLETAYPQTNKNIDLHAKPFVAEFQNQRNRNAMWALVAAVCFVLLIICANLANLLVARGVHRTRETAIRIAVGATRWQVGRLVLIESLLLSFAGGLVGLGFAGFAVHSLSRIADNIRLSARLPFWVTISVDYRMFLYLIVVSFITGIVFSASHAIEVSRTDPLDQLKEITAGTSIRSRRLTAFLVTSEIALTMTLLVAAGLMVRSLVKFQTLDTGPNLLFGNLTLNASRYSNQSARINFVQDVLQELNATPGLFVTAATQVPAVVDWREIHTETRVLPQVATVVVMPGYFNATGGTILQGRDFNQRDGEPGNLAAIVNEQFAAKQWPGEDPIGKRIQKGSQTNSPWLMVIGVSSNLQIEDSETSQSAVYTPYRQEPLPIVTLIAKSRLSHEEITQHLRAEVRKLDPDLPLFNVMTTGEYQAQLGAPLRVFVGLFGLFGALALFMSLMGVYGVTSYVVGRRTREIGIRMTLGATSQCVLWLVLKQGLIQLALGLVLGLAGAIAVSRALSGMLFHTSSSDGLTYVSITVLFVVTTIAACVIPASRAAAVNPAESIRSQ